MDWAKESMGMRVYHTSFYKGTFMLSTVRHCYNVAGTKVGGRI